MNTNTVANAMNEANYQTRNLDHLGLVAAQFDELGLVELIDSLIIQDRTSRNVSVGQAIKAMVINGLGFANHTLYLMPAFFEDKPVERLMGQGITASDINQNLLGRSLDVIHEFGETQLYAALSTHAVKQLGLSCSSTHIDSTSFHVDGDYNSGSESTEGLVQITKGYSRDHRPDLNQVGLELIVENQAGIPLMMQALSGNSNDKTSFSEAIDTHIKQLQTHLDVEYIVGDSALYTAESLGKMTDIFWISRVPETLEDAQYMIEQVGEELMQNLTEEASCSVCVSYAGIKQRWLITYSPEAYSRAVKTVNKQCAKTSDQELKQFKSLCKQEFACEADANKALIMLKKKLKLTEIHEAELSKQPRFNQKGRPAKHAEPDFFVWQITGQAASLIAQREMKVRRKSCYILATNQMDDKALNEEALKRRYKQDQQKVERGFRFLKDPQFLASTLYLKKPKRIMALLMVMTLSLLIYATLEHQIRSVLKQANETYPDQKGKPTSTPSARWIFQSFSGIHELTVKQNTVMILNIKNQHQRLLKLLGTSFQKIYSGTMVLG